MWELYLKSSLFSTHTHTTHSKSTKVLFDRKLTIKWWSCVASTVGIPMVTTCAPIVVVIQVFI